MWLVALVKGLRTLDEVKDKLGRPDLSGSRTTKAADGKTKTFPVAVYMNLSATTYLQVVERGNGAPVLAVAKAKTGQSEGALVVRKPDRNPALN